MAINTTSVVSNAIITKYVPDYINGAMPARLYDQFATPIEGNMSELQRASTVQVNFLGKLNPATSAISQTQDVTPVTFDDATATISPTSRANAIQDAELLLIQSYTNYGQKRFMRLGENQMESVDLLAQAQALQGSAVVRAAARASLDAGTAGHRLTDTSIGVANNHLARLQCPWMVPDGAAGWNQPNWMALMHPDVYHDLRTGGNVITVGQYQRPGIVFNNEVGRIGSFTILADPRAKVFHAAGAANGTAVDTTLAAAASALDKTVTVAANTNIAAGQWCLVGTTETANTHYGQNELVYVVSVNSTTITIIGSGDNGGLMYDHDSGVEFTNADSVYPVVYGGPESLAKLWAPNLIGDSGEEMSVGDMGTIVGPKVTGMVNQFVSLGWKFYGNYGRWSEGWIVRGEYSSSLQA